MTKTTEGAASVADQTIEPTKATGTGMVRMFFSLIESFFPVILLVGSVIAFMVMEHLVARNRISPAEPAALTSMAKVIAGTPWDECGSSYWNRMQDPRKLVERRFANNQPITGADVNDVKLAARECSSRVESLSDVLTTITLQRKTLGIP